MKPEPPPVAVPRRFRFTTRQMVWMVGALCVVFAMCGGLVRMTRDARRAALRSNTSAHFAHIGIAFQYYHDVHGCFPPAYLPDEQGRPMHSWRVLILPYIERHDLYERYDFSEPWDGPNNSQLLAQMPDVFRSVDAPHSDSLTNMVVVVGPETAFPGAFSTRMADFSDGLGNTLLVCETVHTAIPWLAPRDLDVREMSWQVGHEQRPSISSVAWREPYVALADGRYYRLSGSTPPDMLRALASRAGGEKAGFQQLLDTGFLKLH